MVFMRDATQPLIRRDRPAPAVITVERHEPMAPESEAPAYADKRLKIRLGSCRAAGWRKHPGWPCQCPADTHGRVEIPQADERRSLGIGDMPELLTKPAGRDRRCDTRGRRYV